MCAPGSPLRGWPVLKVKRARRGHSTETCGPQWKGVRREATVGMPEALSSIDWLRFRKAAHRRTVEADRDEVRHIDREHERPRGRGLARLRMRVGSNGGGCSLVRVWVRPRARVRVRLSIIHLPHRVEETRAQATEKERRRCDNLLVRCRAWGWAWAWLALGLAMDGTRLEPHDCAATLEIVCVEIVRGCRDDLAASLEVEELNVWVLQLLTHHGLRRRKWNHTTSTMRVPEGEHAVHEQRLLLRRC